LPPLLSPLFPYTTLFRSLALRVGGPAIDEEFVVEMRPGRETGRADVADRLALLDPLAQVQPAGERGEMPVARADPVRMPELDHIAVAAFRAAHADHHAVGGGPHRRPVRRREVHALVGAP